MAMHYQKLKPTLMEFYGVGSTQLDNGEGSVPYSVYCVKNFFFYNGEWVAQDTVKMGKSFSVANRVRTYGQSGADVRLLWNIDCVDANFATKLEDAVHKQALPHHIKNTHATEMFLLNVQEAYNFLDKLEEQFDLKNNNRVLRINRYTPTQMNVFEVNAQTAKDVYIDSKPTAQSKFEELFQ
ncbi:MAG: hypothetical protein VW551_03805 [Euryarchaeota archaeon]|jgi:hypothetical protein